MYYASSVVRRIQRQPHARLVRDGNVCAMYTNINLIVTQIEN